MLVGSGGFEPPKSKTTDLQSVPFGHSGNFPCLILKNEKSGGRWWIRTTEVEDDRFTVCSLWPLGKPPMLFISLKNLSRGKILKWSWWTDSNPRPADYKSAALPTELHQLVLLFAAVSLSDDVYYIAYKAICQHFL